MDEKEKREEEIRKIIIDTIAKAVKTPDKKERHKLIASLMTDKYLPIDIDIMDRKLGFDWIPPKEGKNTFVVTYNSKKRKQTIRFNFNMGRNYFPFLVRSKRDKKALIEYVDKIYAFKERVNNGKYKDLFKSVAKKLLPYFSEDLNKESPLKSLIENSHLKIKNIETDVGIDVSIRARTLEIKDGKLKDFHVVSSNDDINTLKDTVLLEFEIDVESAEKIYFDDGSVSEPIRLVYSDFDVGGDHYVFVPYDKNEMYLYHIGTNGRDGTLKLTSTRLSIANIISSRLMRSLSDKISYNSIKEFFNYLKKQHGIEIKPIGSLSYAKIKALDRKGEVVWLIRSKGVVFPYTVVSNKKKLTDNEKRSAVGLIKRVAKKVGILARDPLRVNRDPFMCM